MKYFDLHFPICSYNTRKLDELPFQHYHLLKNDQGLFSTKEYFTNLDWISAKLAATDTGYYLEDLALIHLDPLPEHIEILKELFEANSYALDYDYRQFYTCLRMTMEKRQRERIEIKSKIVKEWLDIIQDPPVPTFYPANEEFWKVIEHKEKKEVPFGDDFDSKSYDCIIRFETRGKFVATVSTERAEICVWDISQ